MVWTFLYTVLFDSLPSELKDTNNQSVPNKSLV